MKNWELRKILTNGGIFCLIVLISIVLVRCGGSSSAGTGMGSANVTMSDPPSCATYAHVWVTVVGVSASTSGTANSGWEPLVSNLSDSNAVQLDLMTLPNNSTSPSIQCLLAKLGSTSSLPVGNYQQIRLQLAANNATGITLANNQTNNCSTGWNCVELLNQTVTSPILLSSQAQTGLKIPPGQIVGGPISVTAGQSVDIDIDFNACQSIVDAGGQYRLDPTLVAFQTQKDLSGISGQVVQGSISGNSVTIPTTPTGVNGANVALELDPNNNPTDGTSGPAVDLITNWLKQADATGHFDFCPLPSGDMFDIVANAGASATTSGNYNASILTGVPATGISSAGAPEGTEVTIPLIAETGGTGAPGELTGSVSATTGNSNTSVNVNVSALQSATSTLEFADPLLTGSTSFPLSLSCSNGTCTPANFDLYVPSSNPVVGTYTTSSTTWAAPSSTTSGTYRVEATCTNGTNSANISTAFSSSSQTLSVTSGGSAAGVSPNPLALSNCAGSN